MVARLCKRCKLNDTYIQEIALQAAYIIARFQELVTMLFGVTPSLNRRCGRNSVFANVLPTIDEQTDTMAEAGARSQWCHWASLQ